MQRRGSISYPPPNFSDLNIMLLGPSGAGRSASGNTILAGGEKTSEEHNYFTPESNICAAAHTEVHGRRVTVIDTVGLSDTAVKNTEVQTQIQQMIQQTQLDVFLLVVKLGETPTKKKNNEAVKWIRKNLGEKALKHTLVLFTHGDELHVSIEDYLRECEALRTLVDQCSGEFHVFNNRDEDRAQVTELLDKAESLRRRNGCRRYTEHDYKETQKDVWLRKCDGVVAALAAAVLAGAALRAGAGLFGGRAESGPADVFTGAGVREEGTIMASVAPPPGSTALPEIAFLLAVALCAALYFLVRTCFSGGNDEHD